MFRISFFIMLFIFSCGAKAFGQTSKFYTVIQAGGIYGVQSSSISKPMHGYQFQLIFGRNFHDQAYLGFGVGNDSYRGKTILPNDEIRNSRLQTLPLFIDFRKPLFDVGVLGRAVAFVDAGYAPQLSEQYRQGVLGRGGISYEHLLADRSHLKFSLGYGVQQFRSRFVANHFYQQQITLNIGLIVL